MFAYCKLGLEHPFTESRVDKTAELDSEANTSATLEIISLVSSASQTVAPQLYQSCVRCVISLGHHVVQYL